MSAISNEGSASGHCRVLFLGANVCVTFRAPIDISETVLRALLTYSSISGPLHPRPCFLRTLRTTTRGAAPSVSGTQAALGRTTRAATDDSSLDY